MAVVRRWLHVLDVPADDFYAPVSVWCVIFELYNAYSLYYISRQPYCHEWQVLAVAIISFIQASGNIITVCMVIRQKLFPSSRMALRWTVSRKYSVVASPGVDSITQIEMTQKYRTDEKPEGDVSETDEQSNPSHSVD
ncbi:hypothetical protein AHF37_09894 [Paragonimus kellicotti]|nr:hypothetical protein AHF37_09894 [Paragonimus kellicotti]